MSNPEKAMLRLFLPEVQCYSPLPGLPRWDVSGAWFPFPLPGSSSVLPGAFGSDKITSSFSLFLLCSVFHLLFWGHIHICSGQTPCSGITPEGPYAVLGGIKLELTTYKTNLTHCIIFLGPAVSLSQ